MPSIATSIYTSIDKTLIGIITSSDVENGNYEYAERLVKMAMTVVTSLGTVMSPRNSQKIATGNLRSVERNICLSCQYVFFIGFPIVAGLIAVADYFIPWYLGTGYNKASMLVKILSPLIIIIGLSNVFGIQFLIPLGEDKKYTISVVFGSLINVVFNVILINMLASYGAAIASICAETVVTVLMFHFVKQHIDICAFFKEVWKYCCSSIIMGIFCNMLIRHIERSLFSIVLTVIIGIVIYFSLIILGEKCARNIKKIKDSI